MSCFSKPKKSAFNIFKPTNNIFNPSLRYGKWYLSPTIDGVQFSGNKTKYY